MTWKNNNKKIRNSNTCKTFYKIEIFNVFFTKSAPKIPKINRQENDLKKTGGIQVKICSVHLIKKSVIYRQVKYTFYHQRNASLHSLHQISGLVIFFLPYASRFQLLCCILNISASHVVLRSSLLIFFFKKCNFILQHIFISFDSTYFIYWIYADFNDIAIFSTFPVLWYDHQ